ncbi:MAG: chloride channel protein [Oscillospiraceae bacterium]|nr:chloride channel protein [Oscillospiraceae bacterium]
MQFPEKLKKDYLPLYTGFLKWVLLSIMTGITVGFVGVLFFYSIKGVTDFRKSHSWIIWLLPLGGVAIVQLYKAMGFPKDRGTNLVLLSARDGEKMGFKNTICIFISSVITHLLGGSSGREGAALQIGGSMGSQFGQILKLDDDDRKIITMCGMSACFSAIFGTPVTATVFSAEICLVGSLQYSAIVPCIISAVSAMKVAEFFKVTDFDLFINAPEYSLLNYGKIIVLGILCAVVSCIFCGASELASHLYKKIKNQNLRIVTGGIIVAVLTFAIGTFDYNGAGGEIIAKAFTGDSRPEAFIMKILFTALTLGAGFKGGEIVPVFFTGSTFGSLMAEILGIDYSLGAGVGMVAVFCGVTNCPLASIILSVELFGGSGFGFCAIACCISFMLSGYMSLYTAQQFMYSKIKPTEKKDG